MEEENLLNGPHSPTSSSSLPSHSNFASFSPISLYYRLLSRWCFRDYRVRLLVDAISAVDPRQAVSLHLLQCPSRRIHDAGFSPTHNAVWICRNRRRHFGTDQTTTTPLSESPDTTTSPSFSNLPPVLERVAMMMCNFRTAIYGLWTPSDFRTTLLHELVHAFDLKRVYFDETNCKHVACTEIRANHLSLQCSKPSESNYLPFPPPSSWLSQRRENADDNSDHRFLPSSSVYYPAEQAISPPIEPKESIAVTPISFLPDYTSFYPSTTANKADHAQICQIAQHPPTHNHHPEGNVALMGGPPQLPTPRTFINASQRNRCLAHRTFASLLDFPPCSDLPYETIVQCVEGVFIPCVNDWWPFVTSPERDSKWRPSSF